MGEAFHTRSFSVKKLNKMNSISNSNFQNTIVEGHLSDRKNRKY